MRLKSTKTVPKILIILGPTATGKSSLAVKLARKYKGEVVSADSRQVYKGLDIGTGKITIAEMRGVPHHMLDVLSPKKIYTVSEYQKQANEKILEVISRGKLPIVCGGTGFYIQSIVDGIVLPEVPPNFELRKKLEKKTTAELFKMLLKLDPKRAREIEKQNPVRLIRAIEIAKALGSVPVLKKQKSPYDILQIGLSLPEQKLREKITIRLFARIRDGMIEETKNLHKRGLSWKRMRALGLEYRFLADFLEKKITKEELFACIEKGNLDYTKRQMTWFKRDKNIKWFEPNEYSKIVKTVSYFLA